MLNIITMTPWEHRDKYIQRDDVGYEIRDTVDSVFERYIASDAWKMNEHKQLVGELATKLIYAEYLAEYYGHEVDNSPLKIGEKGYTYGCDSYISPINSISCYIKTGLCILCAASHDFKIYTNLYDLDDITIEFLAKREEEYTVYVNLFSANFFRSNVLGKGPYTLIESLSDRITIDGKKPTEENSFRFGTYNDRFYLMYPEYIAQSKKEYDSRPKYYNEAYRFDTTVTLPARDFIMDIERRELSYYDWKDENELEKQVQNGKCTELFLEYEVIIHMQSLLYEFSVKYPFIFAVREVEDGSMECRKFCLVKFPTLLEMLEDMYSNAVYTGCSRVMYAAWDKETFESDDLFRMDLFEDVELYVEIDVKNKQLHIYNNGYFGRKKFFDFYRDDAKFIDY